MFDALQERHIVLFYAFNILFALQSLIMKPIDAIGGRWFQHQINKTMKRRRSQEHPDGHMTF
jgi:hypothetical protein